MSADTDARSGQVRDVDRLVHEPARYNIMALLYVVERAEFLFVQNHTRLTPGNLSAHLKKLEAAGYLSVRKKFVRRMPKTFLELTVSGRKAFENYRKHMLQLLADPIDVGDGLSDSEGSE
jgi:DNA-binding MarR family transcriptional regulator